MLQSLQWQCCFCKHQTAEGLGTLALCCIVTCSRSSVTFRFCYLLQSEDSDTVFEYLVREDNAEWQHWRECVPSWKYPKEQERPKFAQLVIPTLDSVRYEKLLTLAYSVQKVET